MTFTLCKIKILIETQQKSLRRSHNFYLNLKSSFDSNENRTKNYEDKKLYTNK